MGTKESKDTLENNYISWETAADWSWEIAESIDRSGFKPNIIISIIRGGLTPSTVMSDYFELKNLFGIKIEHWGITKDAGGNAVLKEPLYVDMFKKKVLVVDDICNTGQSLKLAHDQVSDSGPRAVKTVTLLASSGSKFKPDFSVKVLPPVVASQAIFPWNRNEYLARQIMALLKDPMGEDALLDVLDKRFNIRPPKKNFKKTLEWLIEKEKLSRHGAYLKHA